MKIGLVTCGSEKADVYLNCLKQNVSVSEIYIWNPRSTSTNGEVSKRITNTDATHVTSLTALLNEVEGVMIADTNHQESLVRILQADRVPVLTEPLYACTLADLECLKKVLCSRTMFAATAFPARVDAVMNSLKHEVKAGALGQVVSICGRYNGKLPIRPQDIQPGKYAGVIGYSIGHFLDIARWLVPSEVEKVYAVSAKLLGSTLDLEDTGYVHCLFENGTTAGFTSNWLYPNAYPLREEIALSVVGEYGTFDVNPYRQVLQEYTSESVGWLPFGDEQYTLLVDTFLGAIKGNDDCRQRLATIEDGIRAQEIVCTVYQTAQTGKMMPCP